MSDYDDLLSSVKELAIGLQALHQLAVEQLTPTVETILQTRNLDVQHIEHALDRLLDHCCHEQALLLYRRLCRHYWQLDPVATVNYINAYREMWKTSDDPIDEQPPSMEVDPSSGDAI
jgi:hypothetical protein